MVHFFFMRTNLLSKSLKSLKIEYIGNKLGFYNIFKLTFDGVLWVPYENM